MTGEQIENGQSFRTSLSYGSSSQFRPVGEPTPEQLARWRAALYHTSHLSLVRENGRYRMEAAPGAPSGSEDLAELYNWLADRAALTRIEAELSPLEMSKR